MKRGFTLLELQISLLLTIIIMSLLFLFTFYFKKNHLSYLQNFRLQRETSQFFSWLEREARNSHTITTDANTVRFFRLDGRTDLLKLEETGPELDGLPFFSDGALVELNMETKEGHSHWQVSLQSGGKSFAYNGVVRLPMKTHLGAALRETALKEVPVGN